jgi:hypothetical protein
MLSVREYLMFGAVGLLASIAITAFVGAIVWIVS